MRNILRSGFKVPARAWVFVVFPVAYALLVISLTLNVGVTAEQEAAKYIAAANDLVNGNFDAFAQRLFYSSYVVFLAVLFKLGFGVQAVVVVQAALQIVASWMMFAIGKRLFIRDAPALLLSALYLFNLPIQIWVTALFTESFFAFVIVWFLYAISSPRNVANAWRIGLVGLLLVFTRPTGVLIFVAGLAALQTTWWPERQKLLRAVVPFILALVFVGYVLVPVDPLTIRCVMNGSIIGGFGLWPLPQIDLPVNLLGAYADVLQRNSTSELVTVMLKRLISYFSLTRPYYSTLHNMAAVPFYILYPIALVGLIRKSLNAGWRHFLIAAIAAFMLLTMLTFDEWTGRYFLPVMVLLPIAAVAGLESFYKPKSKQAAATG
jgi:hypothetical protein